MAKPPKPKNIDALKHKDRRVNNPTAEMASLFEQQEELFRTKWKAMKLARARPLAEGETRPRDADLDPQIVWNGVRISLTREQLAEIEEKGSIEIGDSQLVWRGKDNQDWSDLVVNAPPIYIQEKVSAKIIINDLKRRSTQARQARSDEPDLYGDFNGITSEQRAEAYQHGMDWQNRFILGDSLQVMASLAQREAMKGKVQCIYFDPPYGIKFNSNWQVSTQSRDVKDGKQVDITREPEQVKAFRDTWKDGIHSYLTYLRDRLSVARELLTESGSIFVQIGDENVHRVRAVMDEVFGAENFVLEILVKKKGAQKGSFLDPVNDYVLWFARNPRNSGKLKFRAVFEDRDLDADTIDEFSRLEAKDGRVFNLKDYRDERDEKVDFRVAPKSVPEVFPGGRLLRPWPITNGGYRENQMAPVTVSGRTFLPPRGSCWRHVSRKQLHGLSGMERLAVADRLMPGKTSLDYKRYLDDFPFKNISNWWDGFGGAADQIYIVQTNERLAQRCILMSTDPGDLVLDPTCGSGTTATVAEQWGRRWITIDTSRVALALARTRLMSANYPYYLLADSLEGRVQEGKVTGKVPSDTPTGNDIRQGFVYRRATYITSGTVANNSQIDDIWDKWQAVLEPLRAAFNAATSETFEEWQIPREANAGWSDAAKAAHAKWWEGRIARQQEIDASIAKAADVELLYDRPYEDKNRVRVAGPFTVESLSPHRVMTARDDSLGDAIAAGEGTLQPDPGNVPEADFGAMVLDNLRSAGVHQKDKADTIKFNSVEPWPGKWLAAEGRYPDGEGRERRAGIFIGPEFGTLTRSQITAAAREASEARFDALIACAFNFEAAASDLEQLGPLKILKARMNPDLHMADDLKNTGKGNLFVVFGEPDIDLIDTPEGEIRVRVNGVDVFDPSTGDIRSDGKDGIAAWFIDTDYNEESFFVRHAYFLGANDPYKSLKTALRAEIDEEAWASLYSDISRPFPRPATGRIAVKVINHFGDEVLKVFGV